eukprot:TRINITY_DN12612_c0_g1_i1.p1 TRINITY_DN12612_c0_g1~~TRINITY_DN12612_c0_g1_i1.p1  ORF type:complete len:155 (-),score=25.60 TRINITY_DN12612_c0_g1_i1:78-542(-)
MVSMELKVPPVALTIIYAVLMVIISFSPLSIPFIDPLNSLAFPVAMFGVVFALMGVIQFNKAKTTVNPLSPESSSSLVQEGVYGYSRNPMYVGFFCGLLALSLWISSVTALLFSFSFIIYMNKFQIEPEEAALEKIFGTSYTHYKQRVSRWLFI